jgi:hypothetical protein
MGIKTRNFANNILSGGTIDGTDFLSGTLPSSNITNDSAASVTSIPSISNVVSSVAGDPPSPTLGDIWYNSSTNALKFQGFTTAAWSSGGSLSTGRRGGRGAGVQTAGLFISANTIGPPGTTNTAVTEEYDGSSWTSGGNVNNAAYGFANGGTQTAAFKAGGFYPPIANGENYDGTTWTTSGSLNQTRGTLSGCGTQTAGLAVGGRGTPDTTYRDNAEEYDGSSWTNVTALPKAAGDNFAGGIQTSAISASGNDGVTPGGYTDTFEYNGTSWTTGGSLPQGNNDAAAFGSSSDDIVVYGGTQSPNAVTLKYDGTSWADASANMSSGRRSLAAGGPASTTGSNGFAAGGSPVPSYGTTVEEFNGAGVIAKTFTTD